MVAAALNNVDGDVLQEVTMLVLPSPVGMVDVQVYKLQGAKAIGVDGEVLLCVGVCECLLNCHELSAVYVRGDALSAGIYAKVLPVPRGVDPGP